MVNIFNLILEHAHNRLTKKKITKLLHLVIRWSTGVQGCKSLVHQRCHVIIFLAKVLRCPQLVDRHVFMWVSWLHL